MVTLDFLAPGVLLSGDANSPRKTTFPEKHADGRTHWCPRSVALALVALQLTRGRIPIRSPTCQQLLAFGGNGTRNTTGSEDSRQRRNPNPARSGTQCSIPHDAIGISDTGPGVKMNRPAKNSAGGEAQSVFPPSVKIRIVTFSSHKII
jgi:hypothetical protein